MAIAHVTLATRDVRRTSDFFAATLGWRPLRRPNKIPGAAAWVEGAPGQEMHVVEVPDFEPSTFEREYGRHVAVSFPQSGFAALKERLRQHGAEVMAPDRPTPFERFFFRSPDGYFFEVVAAERTPESSVFH